MPAAEIEAAVIDQLRGIFRQPEIIIGTWRAARAERDDITEDEAREALLELDPLWDELFPAEQARIVQLLVGGSTCGCTASRSGCGQRARRAGARSRGRQEGGGVKRATVSADGETITVHIPLTFRKRGGRKLVVTPDGAEWAPRPRVDNAMVKALARAFRWRRMLDDGMHATLEDMARAKGVNATYVSRVLRLTLLAPDIVEAILDGRQPAEMHLEGLQTGFALEWERQHRTRAD